MGRFGGTRSKFNSDGTLGKLENLKIDYLAGLTFYQNNFVEPIHGHQINLYNKFQNH